MNFIATLISSKCPECQAEKVAAILYANGMYDANLERRFEIYEHLRKLESDPKKARFAISETCKLFSVSRFTLRRIKLYFNNVAPLRT